MQFLTQATIATAFLAYAVFSVPNPQELPPQGGGGGGAQRPCYWKCCEFGHSGTFGTLCKKNASPYPHGVDCMLDMEYGANMTCCHQTDCLDQSSSMPTPIRAV
ncbi:hypothetical protein SBOR_6272 [Sclerotinia borealis F-4128]|uniref:Uncharacterized protein n=1 Tax=Sclerotinia borealis (strain F-4128) TaxID=1432307 RepID=W9CFQ7_SCLBF|nr:hypothetical protein SBOR_6272 [Sclerotinia borealis F-4128]